MKNRNRIIIFLITVAITMSLAVQLIIIPRKEAKRKEYVAAQQNPDTHNINSILKYKNKYIGNSSNYTNLFGHLPLSNIEKSFELFPDELELAVNYKVTVNI